MKKSSFIALIQRLPSWLICRFPDETGRNSSPAYPQFKKTSFIICHFQPLSRFSVEGARVLIAIVPLLILSTTVHCYAGIASENYRITRSVLSGGGTLMVSGSFNLTATLGQPSAIGPSSGPAYLVQGGFWHAIQSIAPGDINGDGDIDLADLILSLQIMARMTPSDVRKQADVDKDIKIGLTEAIYVLGKIAGLRE